VQIQDRSSWSSRRQAISNFFGRCGVSHRRTKTVRLNAKAYLGIVAATNFKQRVRKLIEYYYADMLQYAVAGTPNRLEYDLGFFVKNGTVLQT